MGWFCQVSTSVFSQHKVPTVGILWHAANLEEEMVMFRPFSEGMRELGYGEGRNVIYDHTFVDENYDRFQARAQELVDGKSMSSWRPCLLRPPLQRV